MKRRTFVGAGSALLGAAAAGSPAWSQGRIAGDVRFFCGFPPGGNADLLCRLLAESAKSEIGQNIVVENKAGAGGFIANETLANAAPDGRTIGLAAMAAMAVSPVMPGLKLPINVDTDLTPISPVANVYNVLVFAKSAPFRSVPEMIELAKKDPGKLTYASAGNGTSQHLAGELFKKMAGVDLLHVPYRGGAPAIQDMVSGNVQMMFGNLPEFLGQISGRQPHPDLLRWCQSRAGVRQPAIDVAVPAGLQGRQLVRGVRSAQHAGRPGRFVEQGAARRARQTRDPEALRRERDGDIHRLAGRVEGDDRVRPQEVAGDHPVRGNEERVAALLDL